MILQRRELYVEVLCLLVPGRWSPGEVVALLSWGSSDQKSILLKWMEFSRLAPGKEKSCTEFPRSLSEGSPWVFGWGMCCARSQKDLLELAEGRWCWPKIDWRTEVTQGWKILQSWPIQRGDILLRISVVQLRPQKGHTFGIKTSLSNEGQNQKKLTLTKTKNQH